MVDEAVGVTGKESINLFLTVILSRKVVFTITTQISLLSIRLHHKKLPLLYVKNGGTLAIHIHPLNTTACFLSARHEQNASCIMSFASPH